MKTAFIIGAGPAGLTAGYELLTKTDIIPIIIEQDDQVGGLSKTVNYKGNRIDIGGHRFFSKSDKIIQWWLNILPLEKQETGKVHVIDYHNQNISFSSDKKGNISGTMMVRNRKSRILYKGKFFDYPLQINFQTIRRLGLIKTIRIFFSYLKAKIFPIKNERNLAQFFYNRFGNELYETFFKEYTEKVWGVSCEELPASWGKQRIKDLNVTRLVLNYMKSLFRKDKSIGQKKTDTSLIERFLYPKYGPGQLWETVAKKIEEMGGIIHLNSKLVSLDGTGNSITTAVFENTTTGKLTQIEAAYFFSTMPVKGLLNSIEGIKPPSEVIRITEKLEYRDFLVVGLLVQSLLVNENGTSIKDNWIYIQDKGIKAGRVQIFNNWSPYMVKDPKTTWMGVEYFCNEKDAFWQLEEKAITELAIKEMVAIGLIESEKVIDSTVLKIKKAYPSYHGSYKYFDQVKSFLSSIYNLYPVGRNGMHKYNNTDHSMLTAMEAVDNILSCREDKSNIWDINTEEEYQERKTNE